jgi:hypothetical protein
MDDKKSDGIIQHVFNFDDENRGEIMNIFQYTLLSIIPLVVIVQVINRFIPEADSQKGTIEIIGEIIGEILLFYMGFYFTNKTLLYIHPYSNIDYPTIVLQSIPFMFIILSMNTKISNKINILVDRLNRAWNGDNATSDKKNKKSSGVKISQPISNNQQQLTIPSGDTSLINNLPTTPSQYTQQEEPNFNAMYQNNSTPLIGANSPSYNESFTPMAANEVLGGNQGLMSSW